MNLMENNRHTDKDGWREDLKSEWKKEQDKQDDLQLEDLDKTVDGESGMKHGGGLNELLQKPYMTTVLLGIIVVLLVCIIVLVLLLPGRRKPGADEVYSDVQQSITDYAREQQQNDYVPDTSGEAIIVEPAENEQAEEEPEQEEEEEEEEEIEPVAADSDKTAVVVDVEDENDISYTKEYILNEALPYFADNNQDAIWDLAHLKRYVKLSSGLEGTNQYYYAGDVDNSGRPNGKGLAIYEDNSYYYGDWSGGVRSGQGTWYRFYISEKSKRNAMGKYMSHSYAGEWVNDLPNGQGAEHYDVDISKLQVRERIMQNVVGGFRNSLYDGELYGYTVDYTGTVEEWDAVASAGVFSLWRDMSAIGECSVWRNKDDHNLCLDIDKSENKNQGIRELLKIDTK